MPIGLSLNILGPFFGIYSGYASLFLNEKIQVGVSSSYYDTFFYNPKALGWLSEIRMNYYVVSPSHNGFYIGVSGGYEFLRVQKEEETTAKYYKDFIWSVIPGYNWILNSTTNLSMGLALGYWLGQDQMTPEISIVYLL